MLKSLPIFTAILCVTAVGAQTIPCSTPLSEKQIVDLVQSKVPDGRVQSTVADCGVGFAPTDETLMRLRAAGATSVVLVSIRRKGEQQSWETVKDSKATPPLEDFLKLYPNGQFAAEVHNKLEIVRKREEAEAQARIERMSLAQAKQEVVTLEANIQEMTTAVDANRERELAKPDADYRQRREVMAQVKPKDLFESDADFAERVAKAKDALAELDRTHEAERGRTARRYSDELAKQTEELRRQVLKLRERQYMMEGAKLEFIDYDANQERLIAGVNGEQYWFAAPKDWARDLHSRWAMARVAQPYEEDRNQTRQLVDSETGTKYPGIPKRMAEEIAEARAAAARSQNKKMVGEFVPIPAGEFMMGSASGPGDEKPRHRVQITRNFEIGKYEVTQDQWEAVMGTNPSHYKGANRPVEFVSWEDIQSFLRKLNQTNDGYRYRLPTEAEWEYAARAGHSANVIPNPNTVAWSAANSGRQTHPVGQKQPNAWGLYDIFGNVSERCSDWYDHSYYAASPVTDPQGPALGTGRVVRGGSYFGNVKLTYRLFYSDLHKGDDVGFRVVREVRGEP